MTSTSTSDRAPTNLQQSIHTAITELLRRRNLLSTELKNTEASITVLQKLCESEGHVFKYEGRDSHREHQRCVVCDLQEYH